MSNSKNILYLISLMLLMLTGCEAETSLAPFPNEGEEPIEVRLHATTLGASVEVSRANDETIPLPENTQVGMWGATYQNLTLNYDQNTQALNTTDQSKIYYPLQTETMNIYAYAPYSIEAYDEEDNSIWVRSEFDEYLEHIHYITDPVWTRTSVKKEDAQNGIISTWLKFQHAMSKLQIYFIHDKGKEYDTIGFTINFDRHQYGKMSLETGNITKGNTQGNTYKRYLENPILHPKAETTTPQYDYTILPESILEYIYIYFKDSDGNSWTYEYDFTAEGNTPFPAFEAGKINKMIINLGKIDGSNDETSTPNDGLGDDYFDDNIEF